MHPAPHGPNDQSPLKSECAQHVTLASNPCSRPLSVHFAQKFNHHMLQPHYPTSTNNPKKKPPPNPKILTAKTSISINCHHIMYACIRWPSCPTINSPNFSSQMSPIFGCSVPHWCSLKQNIYACHATINHDGRISSNISTWVSVRATFKSNGNHCMAITSKCTQLFWIFTYPGNTNLIAINQSRSIVQKSLFTKLSPSPCI